MPKRNSRSKKNTPKDTESKEDIDLVNSYIVITVDPPAVVFDS